MSSFSSHKYVNICKSRPNLIDFLQKPKNPKSLVCRYNNYNRPELQINPAKEEVISREPSVIYYHDMLTDYEINLLKERALLKVSI